MRSRYADEFNHDEDAPGYDADVRDEGNPIRAGYARLLDWAARETSVGEASTVLELGTGTGNLTQRLGRCRRLFCVDISEEMLRIARSKLAALGNVEYLRSDLLGCLDSLKERFDAIVSTYALHHLTEPEKSILFRALPSLLEPGGRAVFGDLMFADEEQRARALTKLRQADEVELAGEIESEFFWNLATATAQLEAEGFQVRTEQFSELSWGLSARLKT